MDRIGIWNYILDVEDRYAYNLRFKDTPVCDFKYVINLVSLKIACHGLNEEIRFWPSLSKEIKTWGFQKCKVHCCNFKGFKVTSLQSSACLGFEPRPPAWVTREQFVTHAGGPGSSPSVAKLWRLVTLKSLKLQQCTLHFWKPPVFIFLDKRDQEHSCIFSLWYAIGNTLRFTS